MSLRYQVSIISVGEGLRSVRERIVKAVVHMGHLPIDLVSADVFHQAPVETLTRHLQRTDYLVAVIASDREVAPEIVAKAGEACDLAAQNGIPVLGLLARDSAESGVVESNATASLVAGIESSKAGAVQSLEHPAVATKLLSELFDARPRPGYVSGNELPSSDVASELVRLTKENAELRESGVSFQQGIPEEIRWEPVVGALEDNKILIPVWNKSASVWEQPVETSLLTFFSRIGPQLTVELSAADAAEFVPTGVCHLEARDGRPPWVVPLHSLNLWLTDLLALGLVAPSKRKHIKKDRNQYWSLTSEGREFLAYVRRTALNAGGHRHVGFTSEFPIVVPYEDEDD
ncbi:MAG: hypothetical protein AMS18_03335 [Gemmatimonas sp. SG8_17]|nr:MAG: hypothetical protein AMS18_03335 [Gemmatimonas sp. SG8_17]